MEFVLEGALHLLSFHTKPAYVSGDEGEIFHDNNNHHKTQQNPYLGVSVSLVPFSIVVVSHPWTFRCRTLRCLNRLDSLDLGMSVVTPFGLSVSRRMGRFGDFWVPNRRVLYIGLYLHFYPDCCPFQTNLSSIWGSRRGVGSPYKLQIKDFSLFVSLRPILPCSVHFLFPMRRLYFLGHLHRMYANARKVRSCNYRSGHGRFV